VLTLNFDANRFLIDVILEANVKRAPQIFYESNLVDPRTQFREHIAANKDILGDRFIEYLNTLTLIITSSLKFLVY